jgi:hypothetical protein
MTKHVKNLVGKKFNRITVLSFNSIRGNSSHSYWNCICDCGTKIIIRGSHLKDGGTKSCGCYDRERASKWLKSYATSDAHKGSGNPMWVKKPGYGTVHDWIKDHYDKRKICDHCKKEKKLDWALKKGKKYTRTVNNYLCLCRSCHLKYDYTDERKKLMGKMLLKSRKKKGLCKK